MNAPEFSQKQRDFLESAEGGIHRLQRTCPVEFRCADARPGRDSTGRAGLTAQQQGLRFDRVLDVAVKTLLVNVSLHFFRDQISNRAAFGQQLPNSG